MEDKTTDTGLGGRYELDATGVLRKVEGPGSKPAAPNDAAPAEAASTPIGETPAVPAGEAAASVEEAAPVTAKPPAKKRGGTAKE